MRIRSVRPEFYESESMGDLSWDARFVYVCLWSYVQDNGVNLSNPKLIRGTCMPYDSDRCLRKITRALDDLEQAGCIIRYEHEGKHLLWIPKFSEYQKIKNPGICRFKTPVELGLMSETPGEDEIVDIPTVSDDEQDTTDESTDVAGDPTDSLVDPSTPSESLPESRNPDDKKGTGVGVGVGVGVISTPPTPSRPDVDRVMREVGAFYPDNRFDGNAGRVRFDLEAQWPKIVKAAGGVTDVEAWFIERTRAYVQAQDDEQYVKRFSGYLGAEYYATAWKPSKPKPAPPSKQMLNRQHNWRLAVSLMTDEEKRKYGITEGNHGQPV